MDQLLTIDDLAQILRKSIHSVRNDLSRNPTALPPRCRLPGTLRNLWRRQDVDTWLASYVINPEEPAPPRPARRGSGLAKRGAPTKAERLAKAVRKDKQ